MAEYDTEALVEDVRQRGSLPANDLRFTAANILAAATLEAREGVAPMLSGSRAEHLVYPYSVSVVSGTNTYRMPPRAIGGTLRNVSFVDSANTAIRLRELSQDEVELIGTSTNQGTPFGYFTRNYSVVLVPTPNVSGTLQMPYYARPNKLVELTEDPATEGATTITNAAYNTVTFTLTLTASDPPTNLQPPLTAVAVDVVRSAPGFETLVSATEAQVFAEETSPGVWTYTISSVLENPGVVVGDYLCQSGQAPVPQVPVELQGLLAARTARRLIKAVGDDRWQALEADVAELEDMAKRWLAPRVAGQTQQAGSSIGSSGIGPFSGGWGWPG